MTTTLEAPAGTMGNRPAPRPLEAYDRFPLRLGPSPIQKLEGLT